ncbi:MAG: hypothetical protein ACRD0Y_07110 [Terriglobales bacterium]
MIPSLAGAISYEATPPDYPQSWNEYAYTNNQPLSTVDPSGLCTCLARHRRAGAAATTRTRPDGSQA